MEIVVRRLEEVVGVEQLQEHIPIEHGEHVLVHVVLIMQPKLVVNHVILIPVRISKQQKGLVQRVCVLLQEHIHTENGDSVLEHVVMVMELKPVVNHVTLMFVQISKQQKEFVQQVCVPDHHV